MAAALLAALVVASGARAAELVYWDNYRSEPNTIGVANTDGTNARLLNLGGLQFETSEGMAYDPVSNRLYIAAEGLVPPYEEGEIVYVNLDGSGAGVFTAPEAPMINPEGIAIDPVTRMIYWANTGASDSVSWAKLDGSAGGTLNLTGSRPEGMYRLALNPAAGRVYWYGSKGAEHFISYVNVDNSGGGVLPVTLPTGTSIRGLAADPTSGRLYLLNAVGGKESLEYTGLGGGPLTSIPLGTAYKAGYGLAVDPALGRAYWGNYGQEKTSVEAIGFTSLTGVTGTISPTGVVADGPQDPVIIQSPTNTGAPQLTQSKAQLACSQGSWASDYAGSFVYQSPHSYSYRWTLNGATVAGATASTLTATAAGAYGCTVTATNPAGSASQGSSTTAIVSSGKVQLSLAKRKAKAKPGKLATFKLRAVNGGDLSTSAAKLCVKIPKKAKKALKAPKCKSLGPVAPGGEVVANVKVKVKPTAAAKAYKLTITLPGAGSLTAALKVVGQGKRKG